MKYYVEIDGKERLLEVERDGGGFSVTVDGKVVPVQLDRHHGHIRTADIGNRRVEFGWGRKEHCYSIVIGGVSTDIAVKDSLQRRVEEVVKGQSSVKRSAEIRAPIPGMVRKVLVREGDEVKKGAPILTLDAMKLENEIAAPVDGTVRSIHVQGGSPVEKDQILVIIG